MESYRILLKGLETHNSKARNRCLSKLREMISQGLDTRQISLAIPILTKLASEPTPSYYVIEMLDIAVKKGVDITPALATLKQIAHIPKFAGLREVAKSALETSFEITGEGLLPKFFTKARHQFNWNLIEVNPHPVYADHSFKNEAKNKSNLVCGVCGNDNTFKIYEENQSDFSNTGGIENILVEIECRHCGNFSVFRYYEEIFP